MLINKVTNGFVIQTFDTETKTFTSQGFEGADETIYENVDGEVIDIETELSSDVAAALETHCPFEMQQPGATAYGEAVKEITNDILRDYDTLSQRMDALRIVLDSMRADIALHLTATGDATS